MSSSDEVIFKTAAKAPWGFDSWTFFWEMPKIDPDAVLTYVVIQPDGNEYYSYNRPIKHAPTRNITALQLTPQSLLGLGPVFKVQNDYA